MFKVSKNGKDFIYNAVQIQGTNIDKSTIQNGDYLKYTGTGWVGDSVSLISATGTFYSDYVFWDNINSSWSVGSDNVHIGKNSGQTNQSISTVAIGESSGQLNQGTSAVSIGYTSGQYNQAVNAIAIGYSAGQYNQGSQSIAIGASSGYTSQSSQAIAIGNGAGFESQGNNSVALGYYAGQNNQGSNSVAIGNNSGQQLQGNGSVAIGDSAAVYNQGGYCFAFGPGSGQLNQGFQSISIGSGSGENNQGIQSISMSVAAGQNDQGSQSIAIGYYAGQNNQGNKCIAIGSSSGQNSQGANAIAIGQQSGENNQGDQSIAIGTFAGSQDQHANTIILNASGTDLNSVTSSSFYASPVRNDNNPAFNTLTYNTTNMEVCVNTTKTFVIDHPEHETKYLVHACLEGPEAGVYYRGEGYCDKTTTIELPKYVKNLANQLTVNVSVIQDELSEIPTISSSRVIDGKYFNVFTSKPCYFNWLVIGKRCDIKTEVEKQEVSLKNFGPYTWI